MHLKISSAKWRPFCLGRNVLINEAPGGVVYDSWVTIQYEPLFDKVPFLSSPIIAKSIHSGYAN